MSYAVESINYWRSLARSHYLTPAYAYYCKTQAAHWESVLIQEMQR
jgi:hypothetical protein